MAPRLNLAASEPDHEPSEIHVVVADDHALVRRSLRILLESGERVRVIAEASDIPTVLRHIRVHAPHVLILDLSVSGGSSVEAIRQLRAGTSGTEIVVLTMDDDPAFAQATLDAGAIGFVLKDHAADELPAAVHAAANGERYMSASVAARLASMGRRVAGTA